MCRFAAVSREVAKHPIRPYFAANWRCDELAALLPPNIELDKHGAVLIDTDVEVHLIVALLTAGVPAASVLRDHPTLTADQVPFSCAYAAAHPTGISYPKMTAKAAMKAADLSAFDDDC